MDGRRHPNQVGSSRRDVRKVWEVPRSGKPGPSTNDYRCHPVCDVIGPGTPSSEREVLPQSLPVPLRLPLVIAPTAPDLGYPDATSGPTRVSQEWLPEGRQERSSFTAQRWARRGFFVGRLTVEDTPVPPRKKFALRGSLALVGRLGEAL